MSEREPDMTPEEAAEVLRTMRHEIAEGAERWKGINPVILEMAMKSLEKMADGR